MRHFTAVSVQFKAKLCIIVRRFLAEVDECLDRWFVLGAVVWWAQQALIPCVRNTNLRKGVNKN